jgi:hypothetical protein
MTDDLDAVAAELAAARRELRDAMSACADYVEWKAADDTLAAELTRRVKAAHDRLTAADIAGKTAIVEHQDPS